MIENDAFCNQEWNDKVNEFLLKHIEGDMYAINWNHEILIFNPKENISSQVGNNSIPGFYSDGDHYFFVSRDFSKALLCIAGFTSTYSLMYVVGKELVEDFDKEKESLLLLDYSEEMMKDYNPKPILK